MAAWDNLTTNRRGGMSVVIMFPNSEMSCHMSVFPTRTYKKAHRHGPGRVIDRSRGSGWKATPCLWEEGKRQKKLNLRATKGGRHASYRPNKWFHQHFNCRRYPGPYALHLRYIHRGSFAAMRKKIEDAPKADRIRIDEIHGFAKVRERACYANASKSDRD
jgi:hypothetical protein